ncbi:hypothetical protein CJF30_00008917 [Rutstroemia sp. NJR-2017a BBW]|nr:hypothetical protein CJF30_00008917 [Rutstroemia sp. NJR-2017a BBW]
MHSTALTPRADRILRRTIALAEHKFSHIGSAWLSTSSPSEDLIRRSLAQRNLVYASPGLDLYSLDFLYTFKQALNTYSRTLSAADLSAAVDELRRLVLVQNGRKVAKGYLLRCYPEVGFALSALVDVDEAYKNIYGGWTRQGGIEVAVEDPRSPPALKTVFGKDVEEEELVEVGESAKGRDGQSPVWEVRKEEMGTMSMREDRGPFMRGNRTPNRGTDCSPATKDEWRNLMMGEQRWSLEVVEGW